MSKDVAVNEASCFQNHKTLVEYQSLCLEATPSFGAHPSFIHHICSSFYPSYGPAYPDILRWPLGERGDLPLPAMPRLGL